MIAGSQGVSRKEEVHKKALLLPLPASEPEPFS